MEFSTLSLSAVLLAASSAYLLLGVLGRLFFSPLARIPGPKLAALTSWYEFYWNVVQPGRYIFHIQELHKKYGPIIRVAPNEVHINDVDILDDVFPTSYLREREKNTSGIGVGMRLATAVTPNHHLHRARRDAMGPFFSQKSVLEVESMIQSKVNQYRDILSSSAQDGRVVNFSDLNFAFARDVVFQYCFDKECHLLSDMPRAATLRGNLNELLLGVHVQVQLPWLIKAVESLEPLVGDRLTPAGVINMKELEQSIRADVKEILDRSRVNKKRRSVLEELRDHDDLQGPGELPQRLLQEGVFLMMAGTESAAKTLTIAAFFMMRNKEVMATLREELKPFGPDPSLKQLGSLPYLNAVINEANRLSFGLPGRVTSRVAPSEVVNYKGYAIPPGTVFGMTTLAVHTDPSVFPDPWEFKPERWLGEEGKRRQRYQVALGRGARKCLGINVANAELQLAVSALSRFDMELFETGLDDIFIQHEYQVAYPKLDSKGIRGKVLRKVAI